MAQHRIHPQTRLRIHIILLMTHRRNIRDPVHVADVIVGEASEEVHQVLPDNITQVNTVKKKQHLEKFRVNLMQDTIMENHICTLDEKHQYFNSFSGQIGKSVKSKLHHPLLGIWSQSKFIIQIILIWNLMRGDFHSFDL